LRQPLRLCVLGDVIQQLPVHKEDQAAVLRGQHGDAAGIGYARLVAEPVARRQENKCQDDPDHDVVLPRGAREVPQDEALQHLQPLSYQAAGRHSTTRGWYRFGKTASPIATSWPSRVTALTCREAGCERNGEAGKSRPLRICAAVNSSTNTLGKPGSIFAAGTIASTSRSSAARDSSCAMVRACPISNSPLAVRRSWSRCAPQPSIRPRSCATERMYVPPEQCARRRAYGPFISTSVSSYMCTFTGSSSTAMDSRANSYARFPATFLAETGGGVCMNSPRNFSSALSSSPASISTSVFSLVASPARS